MTNLMFAIIDISVAAMAIFMGHNNLSRLNPPKQPSPQYARFAFWQLVLGGMLLGLSIAILLLGV